MSRISNAAVFTAPGQPLEVRSIAIPDLRPGEVLVRVTACTICGSDLHSFHGRRQVPAPSVLGHEIIGTIERFGPDAPRVNATQRELREGDRVTWGLCVSCGMCPY